MRSKLLFLMLIVLFAFAGPVSAELIVDTSFEAGDTLELNGWGAGGENYGGAWSGTAIKTDGGSDGSNYAQIDISAFFGWSAIYPDLFYNESGQPPVPPVPISTGDVITFSAMVRGNDTYLTQSITFFDAAGNIVDLDNDGITASNDDRIDTHLGPISSDWSPISYAYEVPQPLSSQTIVSFDWGIWVGSWESPGGVVDIDEISLDDGRLGMVYDPDPANGAQGVNPGITKLEWERARSEECPDANSMVELYWGTQPDPNFWVDAIKIMDLADVDSFDLPFSLDPDKEYFWALKFDPNACDPGDDLVEGPTWSFDTINRAPVVNAGLHYDRWQNGSGDDITIGIDASYTDDGLPVGGKITHSWNTVSGVVYFPHPNCQDPNVTISTPGDYILELTVSDGKDHPQEKTGSNKTLIRIFANDEDRLRAHYRLDGNANDSDPNSYLGTPGDDRHDGSLNDDPLWGTGQVLGAIELDGEDDVGDDGFGDFVSIDDTGSDPNWQADTWENTDLIDGMTVSAWMKLDADGWSKDWETIVAKSTDSWELLRSGSGDGVGLGIKGGIGSANSAGIDVTSGWHQVAGVYDRNKVVFYVDGLETESNEAGTLDLDDSSNFDHWENPINDQDWQVPKTAGKILIGNTNNPSINSTADLTFGGLIDQVRIYDAAVPHRAEHAGTPGIVELYRADGGHTNCGGVYIPGDVNEDCYVTLVDFAIVSLDWLDCTDVIDEDCPLWHHEE